MGSLHFFPPFSPASLSIARYLLAEIIIITLLYGKLRKATSSLEVESTIDHYGIKKISNCLSQTVEMFTDTEFLVLIYLLRIFEGTDSASDTYNMQFGQIL